MHSPQIAAAAAMPSPPRVPLVLRLRLFSAATTLSLIGTFIQKVAVSWAVWEATHATIWLAAVGAAAFGWFAHLTDIRLSCVTAAVILVLLMLWIVSQTETVSIRVVTPPRAAQRVFEQIVR